LSPMMLCGTMFGLSAYDSPDSPFAKKNSPRPCLFLARHRLFETSFPCDAFSRCDCAGFRRAGAICAGVYGGGRSLRKGNRGGYTPNVNVRRELMQCDWMSGKELSQAIPPAYTAYIGRKLYQSASGGVI
jgi:DNA (cytosine-5)-methyltransferase 1